MNKSIRIGAVLVMSSTAVQAQVQTYVPTRAIVASRELKESYSAMSISQRRIWSENRRRELMSDIRGIRAQIRKMAQESVVNHSNCQRLAESIGSYMQNKDNIRIVKTANMLGVPERFISLAELKKNMINIEL